MTGINKHPIYGLLYIILLPAALLMGIVVLLCMVQALSNLLLLIPLFIVACFTVYTIASFVFYRKAIRRQLTCKISLRDLIRINAFIIVLPALFLLLQSVLVVADPGVINTVLPQLKTMQPQMPAMQDAALVKLILRMYYFLMAYAIAILIHVVYTFRLLQQYKSSFVSGVQ